MCEASLGKCRWLSKSDCAFSSVDVDPGSTVKDLYQKGDIPVLEQLGASFASLTCQEVSFWGTHLLRFVFICRLPGSRFAVWANC